MEPYRPEGKRWLGLHCYLSLVGLKGKSLMEKSHLRPKEQCEKQMRPVAVPSEQGAASGKQWRKVCLLSLVFTPL